MGEIQGSRKGFGQLLFSNKFYGAMKKGRIVLMVNEEEKGSRSEVYESFSFITFEVGKMWGGGWCVCPVHGSDLTCRMA